MIYANIQSKPIVELDEFFNIDDIVKLEGPVAMAISKNKSRLTVGFSGPNDNNNTKTWLDETEYQEVKNSWVQINREIPINLKDSWNSLTSDQQLFYTLLTTKSKSLNYILSLRCLSNNHGGNSGRFQFKHLSSETMDTPCKKDFEFLFDWIKQNDIFDEIGRVQFFINPEGHATPIHRDYPKKSFKDQYIWMRFNKQKDFFVYDDDTKEKHFVKGYICTFDNYQWHGSEANECAGFSLRVDGLFSQSFLEKTSLKEHFK